MTSSLLPPFSSFHSYCNDVTCSIGYKHTHHKGSVYANEEAIAKEAMLRQAGLKLAAFRPAPLLSFFSSGTLDPSYSFGLKP